MYGDVALEEWRDYIESEIDRMLQEQIVGDVEWVQKETAMSRLLVIMHRSPVAASKVG